MSAAPVDLDGRRRGEGRLKVILRRKAVNSGYSPKMGCDRLEAEIDARLARGPALDWAQALDAVRFLLDQYAAAPEARAPQTRRLIDRALGDLARLKIPAQSTS